MNGVLKDVLVVLAALAAYDLVVKKMIIKQ